MPEDTYDPTDTTSVQLDSEELKFLDRLIREELSTADLLGPVLTGMGEVQKRHLLHLLRKVRAARSVLKNRRFLEAYGSGPKRFIKVSGITPDNAEAVLRDFNAAFPGIKALGALGPAPRPKKAVSKRPRKPQERSKSVRRATGPSAAAKRQKGWKGKKP